MKVISCKEQKDGSAILSIECSLEEESIFLRLGIEELIKELKLKTVRVESKKIKSNKNVKQIELTEEESSYLIGLAVNKILRDKIKEEDKK